MTQQMSYGRPFAAAGELQKGSPATRPSMLERAFALARSGKFANLQKLQIALKREGYDVSALEGRTLRKQIRTLIAEARGATGPTKAAAKYEGDPTSGFAGE